MKTLNQIIAESFANYSLLCEGGNDGHMNHLFDQGQLTFSEIRDIFKKLFTGKLGISEKIDGMNLNVTFKDGEVKASRNTSTLKNPLSIKELAQHFDGRDGDIKTAFVKTMKDLSTALSSIDQSKLNKFFANGRKFMSIEIVYPTTRNIVDYGNRCMIVLHGINVFNDKFKRIGQDKEAANELFSMLKKHDALKQETFEISGPVKLKLKNIKDNETALNEILAELDKIVDGFGYKATVAEYAQERFKKYIVNMATKAGLDLNRNSDFVVELADRMSNVSGRNPTKSDIATYAKKEGLDIKSDEYKNFVNNLLQTAPIANSEVIAPLEDLVVKAGTVLMSNIEGYISLDPSGYAKKLATEIDSVKKEFNNNDGLTPQKVAMFKKNLVKLNKYGEVANPAEGIVFLYKGSPYKLTGNFGAINQILNFFRK